MLKPDEPHATVVCEAIEGFAIGRFQTQAEVKRFLESKSDYPHNKNGTVRDKRVTDLLSNPLYTGYICSEVYELNWLKGQHPPLISMTTYEKVQSRLKNTGYAPARVDIGEDFSLRGFATCGDCEAKLRSSWSKGKTKYYPYYLCHTKGCASYGKSIPRDKIEGAFADVVKTLEPSPKYLVLAKTMFKRAWEARLSQVKDAARATKRQIADADAQIEALLSRIMQASNDAVIGAYESKITELEKSKVRMAENLADRASKPKRYEDFLELSLKFLSSPWKIWESGDKNLRRIVLRLGFSGGFSYHRIEGPRTPKIALPFKALGMLSGGVNVNGAEGED